MINDSDKSNFKILPQDMNFDGALDYSAIFNAASNGMAITEFESGKIVDINETWIKATGFSKEYSVGKTATELGLWRNISDRALCIDELKRNNKLVNFETYLIVKSVELAHLISAEKIEMNGAKYILWEFRNISEQKRINEELLKGEEKVKSLLGESELSRRALLGILEDEKFARDALNQSEKQFRSILENISLLGIILDKEGRITLINDFLLNLTGWQRHEVLNKSWFKLFIPEEIRDEIKINIFNSSILKAEIPPHMENEIVTKNGEHLLIAWNNTILYDHHGIVSGVASIGEDITIRKRNEHSLKESELRYRMVSEIASDYVYKLGILANGDASLDFISDSFYAISGRKKENIYSIETWKNIFHKDDLSKIMKIFKSLTESQESVELECRSYVHNNRLRWIKIIAKSEWNEKENRVTAIYGAIKDITAHKNSEIALAQSEEKFSKAFIICPEAISIASLDDGKYIDINDEFLKVTGFTREEVLEHTSGELNVWVSHEERERYINQIISAGNLKNFETQFRMKSGEIREFLVSSETIELEGKPCSLNFILDITENKKVERQLEAYRKDLEFLVKERTEELAATIEELHATNEELYAQKEELEAAINSLQLTQNQLIQSEKMASLGVLAAGIAHEINNPLNFIHGGLMGIEKYYKKNLNDQIEYISRFIDAIKEGVKRATEIVKSLSQYSRHDDHLKLKCDLHQIIDNCLTMLQNQLKNRINIEKQYTPEAHLVLGNEGKFHQIFLNLLSNAEQAIDGEGSIVIETRIEGLFLTLSIRDSGCGISPQNLHKIFDPFFTTKVPGKGTGLGLSIAMNIIQEHQGTIEFKSKLNEGTTVLIKFPVTD